MLRNRTFKLWEAAGCPRRGQRPEEDAPPAIRAGRAIPRYNDDPPLAGDQGAVEERCLYAGKGCKAIEDVPTAADMLDRLAPR